MRKFALGLVAASFIAVPALAQTPLTFADVDSNGDGRLSFEELQLVWPDLTAEEFAAADIEGAGSLTPDQLNALQPVAAPADAAAPVDPMAPVPTPVDPAALGPVDALPPTPTEPVDEAPAEAESLVD